MRQFGRGLTHPFDVIVSHSSTWKFVSLVHPSAGRRNCNVGSPQGVQSVGPGFVPEGQSTLQVVLRVEPLVDEGSG